LDFDLTTILTIQIPNAILHIPMVDENSLKRITIIFVLVFNHKIKLKVRKCKKMCKISTMSIMTLHQTPLFGRCEHLAHKIVDKSTII
jgi:hypothetical protein